MTDVETRALQGRRAGQDAPQRSRAEPVRDRADLRERQRRHRSSDDDDGDAASGWRRSTAWRACCTRSRSPASTARASTSTGRMSDDARQQPAEPGRHAARQHAVPGVLRRGAARGQQVAGAAALQHRQRRQRSPPRRERSAAGDHLDLPRRHAHRHLRADREGRRRRRPSRAACSTSASSCCRSCRATPATATAPARSRSPATSSSSARCRRTRASRCPNIALNVAVAESLDYMRDRAREGACKGGKKLAGGGRGAAARR